MEPLLTSLQAEHSRLRLMKEDSLVCGLLEWVQNGSRGVSRGLGQQHESKFTQHDCQHDCRPATELV